VRPDEGWPRSATVAVRGRPAVPRISSSAANPVGTTRPSRSGGGSAGRSRGGAAIGGRSRGVAIGGASGVGPSSGSSSSGSGIGALASAPSTGCSSTSPPRRGAAAPQRAWSVASASETSDARPIGRPILEHVFYWVKVLHSSRRESHPVARVRSLIAMYPLRGTFARHAEAICDV
jgi:hypothetical protein